MKNWFMVARDGLNVDYCKHPDTVWKQTLAAARTAELRCPRGVVVRLNISRGKWPVSKVVVCGWSLLHRCSHRRLRGKKQFLKEKKV